MAKVIGEDFSSDIKINRFKLEEECELQPFMYQAYGEHYANAKTKRDACKDKLDLILAQRDMYYRMNPPAEVKATEAVYAALLAQDTEVLNAKEELRKANEALYHLDVAMTSLDHRKAQLDNLVALWTKSYYSGTNPTKDAEIDARKRLNKKEND